MSLYDYDEHKILIDEQHLLVTYMQFDDDVDENIDTIQFQQVVDEIDEIDEDEVDGITVVNIDVFGTRVDELL